MKWSYSKYFLVLLISVLWSCSNISPDNLKILRQQTGFLNANCYLIYDLKSCEAALIDPGDIADSLIHHIESNGLILKYIFVTHCHPDHINGIVSMRLREKFPKAKICFSREEYIDMFEIIAKWEQNLPGDIVEKIKGNNELLNIFNMDYYLIGKPDVFVMDEQVFKLGKHKVRAIKTPGHARGSISYYAYKYLFTGDELFYTTVGNTKNLPVSSFETQVNSIRKLYSELPDETIVYPGHGNSTTIGFEKTENNHITMDKAIR